MSKKLRVFAWLAVIGLFASPLLAQSQATTGEIQGRITDSAGGVLSGAMVTLSDASRAISRTVTTDSEGVYVALLLPPGTYEVSAAATGFQTTKYKSVEVTVGAAVTLNITMKVGGLEEALTVEARGAAVETTATVHTSTVNMKAMENLPINGRRFQDFVNLTPTAQTDPQRGQISLSGQRGINANISVDGADYNQPFFGGIRGGERSNFAFTVPQESIQEFQVVSSGYSAEFGRSTGGIVNAVTKSGTNSFRGSAFYLNRNKDLASKNVFGQNAAPTQNQFGGSIGGPLMKDKLFFFAAYEQQSITDPRAVIFSNLVGFTPLPSSKEAFDFYTSLQTPFEATNNAKALLGRIDYQFSGSHRLSLRYSHSSSQALNATSVGNSLNPTITNALSNNGTEKDSVNSFVAQFTSVLKPSLLLDARGQYSKETRPRLANEVQTTVTNAIGTFGTVNFLPTTQFDWRAQGAASLAWLKGKHVVKLGTEYNHVYVDQTFGFNQFGVFGGFPTATATILDIMSVGGATPNRFDNTQITYLKQLGNLLLNFSTDELAFYAQDTWRIRPNLTVNYGLRWEGAWNPTPAANNQVLLSQVQGFTFPSGRQVDPTQIPDQLDQFAPRVGFSWDPWNDGKTAIRAYGGMYYARTPNLIYAGPMNNYRTPPGDVSAQLPLAVPAGNPNNTVYKQMLLIGIDLNKTPLNQLPNLSPDQIQAIAQALGLPFNPFVGAGPIAVDTGFQNPRAYQVGLGGEREVAAGFTLGLEGVVVKTTHLERNFDLNQPLPVIRATDPAQRPFYGLTSTPATPRPIRGLNTVQVRESTARSLFRALVFSAKLQKKWGQFNVSYVLSNSKSDDDNERDAGGVSYVDTYNLAPEYGPARLDRRNQANGSVLFFLPAGFDFGAGFNIASGVPISAIQGVDANGDRVNNDRPYHAPGVPFTRNEFRDRSIYTLNLRVQWTWKLHGSNQVTVAADFFNPFNFSNIRFINPTGTVNSVVTTYCANTADQTCGFGAATNPNFLQIYDQNPASTNFGKYLLSNTPGSPRQIQLGIRYQF